MATHKLPSLTAGGSFVTVTLGSLQARKAKDGQVHFFWRYNVTIDGVLHLGREAIGRFDGALPPHGQRVNRNDFAAAVPR